MRSPKFVDSLDDYPASSIDDSDHEVSDSPDAHSLSPTSMSAPPTSPPLLKPLIHQTMTTIGLLSYLMSTVGGKIDRSNASSHVSRVIHFLQFLISKKGISLPVTEDDVKDIFRQAMDWLPAEMSHYLESIEMTDRYKPDTVRIAMERLYAVHRWYLLFSKDIRPDDMSAASITVAEHQMSGITSNLRRQYKRAAKKARTINGNNTYEGKVILYM